MVRKEQEKRDKKIVEAYNSGEKVRSLSAFFGLSTQQINTILNRYIPERKKTLDK